MSVSKAEAIRPVVYSERQAGRYVGYTVSWDFARTCFINRKRVAEVFIQHNFESCCERDDLDAAKALMSVPRTGGGRGIKIEILERPNRDTPAVVVFYRKTAGDERKGDNFVAEARVRVENDRVIAKALEGAISADSECMQLAQGFAREANLRIDHVDANELSSFLTAVGKRCAWINYRDNGGVWFVYDSPKAESFKQMLVALRDIDSTRPFNPRIQPLFIDDDGFTKTNVSESSKVSLEKELSELVEKLDKMKADGLRQSTIERAIDSCDDLVSRAEFYKSMLEDAADEIATRIKDVRTLFQKELDGESSTVESAFDEIEKALSAPAGKRRRVTRAKRPAPVDDADDLFNL